MKKQKKLMGFLLILSFLILCVNVEFCEAGQDITFTWDSYTSDPIVGFKLYMASAPGVQTIPGNLVATIPGQAVTTYKQVNAPVGIHYWVLTTYTATMESDPSNEVSYTVKLKPPSGLGAKVVLSLGNITVTVASK